MKCSDRTTGSQKQYWYFASSFCVRVVFAKGSSVCSCPRHWTGRWTLDSNCFRHHFEGCSPNSDYPPRHRWYSQTSRAMLAAACSQDARASGASAATCSLIRSRAAVRLWRPISLDCLGLCLAIILDLLCWFILDFWSLLCSVWPAIEADPSLMLIYIAVYLY